MTIIRIAYVISIAPLTLMLDGCGNSYSFKDQKYTAQATVRPSFTSIQSKILIAQCMRCHGTQEHEDNGGVENKRESNASFSSYLGIKRYVVAGNPVDSELFEEMSTGAMPPDAPRLSDDEILAVYEWIANGAKDD